jgi:hypothetical protein
MLSRGQFVLLTPLSPLSPAPTVQLDVAQVTNFRRRVLDFRLEELPGCGWGGRRLLQLHIRGTAFLWHQVRWALLWQGHVQKEKRAWEVLLAGGEQRLAKRCALCTASAAGKLVCTAAHLFAARLAAPTSCRCGA